MENLTTNQIADIYSRTTVHVDQINNLSALSSLTDKQKNKISRSVQFLEDIKDIKKEEDHVTSIWTTEDFGPINAAITLGKTKYE